MFEQKTSETEQQSIFVTTSGPLGQGLEIKTMVRDLCARLAPLWSLERFIAVNPFQGWTQQSFLELAIQNKRDLDGDIYPEWSFFQGIFDQGKVSLADLEWALKEKPLHGVEKLNPENLIKNLKEFESQSSHPRFPLPSESSSFHAHASQQLEESIGQFCAVHFDQAQTAWSGKNPQQFLSLWLQTTVHDRSWDMAEMGFVRNHLRLVEPSDPWVYLEEMVGACAPKPKEAQAFLRRLMQSMSGWLAYGRFLDRELYGEQPVVSEQIFLARALTEWAVWKEFGFPQGRALAWRADLDEETWLDLLRRDVWLRAYEHALRCQWLPSWRTPLQVTHEHDVRYQFVFCIDPRSESMRRHLEAQHPSIETIGFAGFFGVPVAARNDAGEITDRCPFLLPASVYLDAPLSRPNQIKLLPDLLSRHLNTCFSYVETLGLLQLPRLLARSFVKKPVTPDRLRTRMLLRKDHSPVSVEDRAAMARVFLKHSGLKGRLATYVLLCGHGASSPNNPFASSLACGACGGHRGDINALVACQILNDPEVRALLASTEWAIPEETRFIPLFHETCGQTLQFLDESTLLPDAEKERLAAWLVKAQDAATIERAEREGRPGDPKEDAARRAGDWSEVRPEWGLANNLYFIAAPRYRTAGLNLQTRAFLHNYNAGADTDGQTLELILTAPLLVAHGINLQYYASRTDPLQQGSGSKVLHNPVGTFGVLEGTSYQLRAGLPWQSIHDGQSYRHEPVRLQVFIQASTEAIESVLQKHHHIEQLVTGDWISLMALDEEGHVRQRHAGGLWQEL